MCIKINILKNDRQIQSKLNIFHVLCNILLTNSSKNGASTDIYKTKFMNGSPDNRISSYRKHIKLLFCDR